MFLFMGTPQKKCTVVRPNEVPLDELLSVESFNLEKVLEESLASRGVAQDEKSSQIMEIVAGLTHQIDDIMVERVDV